MFWIYATQSIATAYTCSYMYAPFNRARINRRPSTAMAVGALVIGRNALKNIGLLTAKNRVLFFPLGRDALAVLCVPFCAAVMPFFQRLVLPFFRFEYSNNFLPIGIQIIEWTENCDPLIHSAEKKCKTKISNAKLQNYPPQNSLKLLLPIVNTVTIL